MPAVASASTAMHVDQKPVVVPASQPTVAQKAAIEQAAVVLDIASDAGAPSTLASKSLTADPNQVGQALALISGSNAFIYLYEHTGWDRLAAFIGPGGQQIVAADKAAFLNNIGLGEAYASSDAANAGVPTQQPSGANTGESGAILANTTVSNFTFTSGGSTYAVTNDAYGALIGTKDGKPWQTWQLIPTIPLYDGETGERIALSSLTAADAQTATASAAKDAHKVDLSA